MDSRLIEKLDRMGALSCLGTGKKAVRVTMQYQPALDVKSRDLRRRALYEEFERVRDNIESKGAEVDLESLSVSGQTVEALLPLDRCDEIEENLRHCNVRVDLLVDRKIV